MRALLWLGAGTAVSAIVLGAAVYVVTSLPLGYVVAIAASIGLVWLTR